MPLTRIAYMPLVTYPEAVADDAIQAAVAFAATLNCSLQVTAFAVDLPSVSSGLGDLVLNIPSIVQAAKESSKAECRRLQDLVRSAAGARLEVQCASPTVMWGGVLDTAAVQARYFDLALLPWSGETVSAQDVTQAVLFGSGRPTIAVPPAVPSAALDHIAIAWDGSRVAARALGDALPLLADGGRLSVLTVQDEKPLSGSDLAGTLALSLQKRGFNATPVEITLGKRTIAEALQDTALSNGARLLAMGGFGHSRIRDFILGGATKGIMSQLRLPILLSH